MDIPANIHVPDYIYNFYQNAAKNIANQTPEQTMADALSAYAAILSKDIMKARQADIEDACSGVLFGSV